MHSVLIAKSPQAVLKANSEAISQKTRFADLPLPARLLLAVPRVRGVLPQAPLAERYVLDTLGRAIDSGPGRECTIEAVNLLAEVMLADESGEHSGASTDEQWLSVKENLFLCVLCKVRSGEVQQASELAQHWINRSSLERFNIAATALCDSGCFKQGGPHVFTPGCGGTVSSSVKLQSSVRTVNELSLGELVLLNAIRLRIRTLSYARIKSQVLPLFGRHLALPRLSRLVDAHLVESLQYTRDSLDIRCFCAAEVSADEARLLSLMAVFSNADAGQVPAISSHWLPADSIERLKLQSSQFQEIVQQLGFSIPLRDWNMQELESEENKSKICQHLFEPAVCH